jgi:hypothetical protein
MQNEFRRGRPTGAVRINEYGGRSVIALSGNVNLLYVVENQTGDAILVEFIGVAEVEQRTKPSSLDGESKYPCTWSESIGGTRFSGPCTIGHPSRFGNRWRPGAQGVVHVSDSSSW